MDLGPTKKCKEKKGKKPLTVTRLFCSVAVDFVVLLGPGIFGTELGHCLGNFISLSPFSLNELFLKFKIECLATRSGKIELRNNVYIQAPTRPPTYHMGNVHTHAQTHK